MCSGLDPGSLATLSFLFLPSFLNLILYFTASPLSPFLSLLPSHAHVREWLLRGIAHIPDFRSPGHVLELEDHLSLFLIATQETSL